MEKSRKSRKSWKEIYDNIITDQMNITLVTLGLLIILIVIPSFIAGEFRKADFWDNIIASANSMVFDLFVIGVFITGLSKIGEKKRQIQQYMNEIDDFRDWPQEEAARRIRGSIIRLNKLGINKIDLRLCTLAHTNLEGVDLTDAVIIRANLSGCYLENSTFEGVDFYFANLAAAKFCHANLSNANLTEADLSKADLSDANLTGAVLKGATLSDAILTNAILDGANLIGARNITPLQVSRVKSAKNVLLDELLKNRVKILNPRLFEDGEKS
jgi:hypothetical protein